jgi:hypothetical protein
MTTAERIAPIIFAAYGESSMTRALVNVLADKVERDDFDSRGREHGIMLVCWMRFPGGGTAARVAADIEAVLQ